MFETAEARCVARLQFGFADVYWDVAHTLREWHRLLKSIPSHYNTIAYIFLSFLHYAFLFSFCHWLCLFFLSFFLSFFFSFFRRLRLSLFLLHVDCIMTSTVACYTFKQLVNEILKICSGWFLSLTFQKVYIIVIFFYWPCNLSGFNGDLKIQELSGYSDGRPKSHKLYQMANKLCLNMKGGLSRHIPF